MKIALITDLHEYDPEYVLQVLAGEKPDMICAAGDILERHIRDGYEQQGEDPDEGDMSIFSRIFIRGLTRIKHAFYPDMEHPSEEFARYVNSENSYRFFREASKIAQVFYSPGNHERYYTDQDRQVIRETGIVFLDNSEAAWKGIRVGGLSSTPDMDWLQEYNKRPGYKLLLCHHPEFYDKYLKDTDIDLILDWRLLGYGLLEPWAERSNTKQDAFNKEANRRAEIFLAEDFLPVIRQSLSEEIGEDAQLYIEERDPQTVIFSYPKVFHSSFTLQVIRLEIGALAAWTPAQQAQIEPYAAKYYPHVFEQPTTSVLTVTPERTFWEKATILHQEANRPERLEMPLRYSRHYYDLYRMANSNRDHPA